MWLVAPYTIVAGGSFLGLVTAEEIGGGYLNAFFLWGNVFGPALIFGGTEPRRALWASPLLLRVVPGREKMVEGKKKGAAAHSKKCNVIFRDTDVQKAQKCTSKLRNPL